MIEELRVCWATLDGPARKRLAPALPQLVWSLCRHRELDIDDSSPSAVNHVSRRTVGYWRYDNPGEVALLNQIWAALSPLINLFTLQQKLLTKTRVGAEVTKI